MDTKKIKQLIENDKIDAVETAWMGAIEAGEPLASMREALDVIVAAERPDTAETLAWMFLSDAVEQRPAEEALNVARKILPALPGNDDLRQTAADLYASVHGEAEHFQNFMDASGLLANQSLRRAIRTMDTSLAARPGTYLVNRFDHQVVRVKGFDDVMGQFDLLAGSSTTELEPKLLADEFDPVDETDFRVLCQFRTDELGELIQKEITSVLIGICMSHGGQITATDLKDLLVGKFLESSKWSGWWNRARTAAKRSDSLSLEGRNPTTVCYHPHGRSLEEELADAVKKALMPLDYLAILKDYSRDLAHRKLEMNVSFVSPLIETLAEQAHSYQTRRPADALAASLAIDAAIAMGMPVPTTEHPTTAEALADASKPAQAIMRLDESSLWPAAYDALAKREDAADHFETLLAAQPANQLDDIASRLRAVGRGDAIERIVTDALAKSSENVQICLWLWLSPAEPPACTPGPLDQLSRLLGVMEEINRNWDFSHNLKRDTFGQIRAAMLAYKCKKFRQAMTEMDEGVAATIKRRIDRSPGLSDVARDDLLGELREDFGQLFLKEKLDIWLDENVNWTTQAALDRRQAELKDLIEFQLPANSRAIGAAADLGDLSENSEWQAAVEEQRRLQGKVASIRDDLTCARVLHKDDVPTNSVGIGSRVTVKNIDTGEEMDLTFLGAWDSDVANRIFSYKTPLAQSLMGKSPGERVTLKLNDTETEYVIGQMESGL